MLSKKMQDALNQQVNAEYFSSYLYLSMAAYFQAENLNGMATWMKKQSQEELMHALKIFDYIDSRGGKVTLTAIDAPETAWKSPLAVFEATCKHEAHVTSLIHNLVNLAKAEKDHATESFLIWFVNEQVEEEDTAQQIVAKLKLVKDAPSGIFLMDRELGMRA
ncbi:ferritin [bacterium]|nr:ferritin [bacterium]